MKDKMIQKLEHLHLENSKCFLDSPVIPAFPTQKAIIRLKLSD